MLPYIRKEETMARYTVKCLDADDLFPPMELRLLSGDSMNIPDELGDGYSVVLFYRGYW